MAVGFDAASEFPTTASAGASNTLTLSWGHIPVTSTPKGVGVFVSYSPSSLTLVTAVRYGGVDLTRRAIARDNATESGVMEFWYLGAGIPTGNQPFNVLTPLSGAGMWGVGFTVSASFSTTVAQSIIVENDTSLNQKTLSTVQVGVRFAGAYYGGAAPPTTGANSTTIHTIDYGAYGASVVRETTAGSGNRVVGFAAGTADDVAAIYVAIDEEVQIGPSQTLSLSSKESSLTFGTVSLLARNTLAIASKTSDAAFGAFALNTRTNIALTGLVSGQAFGSFGFSGNQTLNPTSHIQVEQFGQANLNSRIFAYPTSLASAFDTGNPTFIVDQFLFLLGSSFTEFGQFTLSTPNQLIIIGGNIFEWFAAQTNVQGSKLDRLKEYLNSQGYSGNSNGMLFKFLRDQGYKGSLAQMISKFERDYTNRYGPA